MGAETDRAELAAALEKVGERVKKELLQRRVRKELLQIWCKQTLDFMQSVLVEQEMALESAEDTYREALNIKDWGDDEEKVLSRLKRKVELRREHLASQRLQVMRFEKSAATLLELFKCDENSTKNDTN